MSCTRIDIVGLYRDLRSESANIHRSVPSTPFEPSAIAFLPSPSGIGGIGAPSFPFESLSIVPRDVSALPGRSVAFAIELPLTELDITGTGLLRTLSANIWAEVGIDPPGGTADLTSDGFRSAAAPPNQLSVAYEPSVALGEVVIRIAVPTATPDGSRLVIRHVIIAGCEVALTKLPAPVKIGYNHSPESRGSVYAAAAAGDVPALTRLLEGGASTEEKDAVSCSFLAFSEVAHRSAASHPPLQAGRTPLIEAAGSGQVGAVKLLLDCGADVRSKDSWVSGGAQGG
jgi:hypothetical protein